MHSVCYKQRNIDILAAFILVRVDRDDVVPLEKEAFRRYSAP